MTSYQLLQDQVYDRIKKRLLSGEMEGGVVYSEAKLAAELGVSKTPVKAAIQRLSQERFITIMPSRGFCLRVMTVEDVWEMFHVRAAIEVYCAVLLMQGQNTREGAEILARMENSIDELRRFSLRLASDPNDADAVTQALENNILFHRSIIEYSKSETFMQLFRSHCHSILKSTSSSIHTSPRTDLICEEHQKIVEAIRRQDELACSQLIREHIRSTRDRSLRLLQQTEN